jgi:hypothetical protein
MSAGVEPWPNDRCQTGQRMKAHISRQLEIAMTSPNTDGPYAWVWVDSTYLRDLAQRCGGLARDCPHAPTSHQLEAIGVELMQKAAELDQLQQSSDDDLVSDDDAPPAPLRKKR